MRQLLISWEPAPKLAIAVVKFQEDQSSPVEVHLRLITLHVKRAASLHEELFSGQNTHILCL